MIRIFMSEIFHQPWLSVRFGLRLTPNLMKAWASISSTLKKDVPGRKWLVIWALLSLNTLPIMMARFDKDLGTTQPAIQLWDSLSEILVRAGPFWTGRLGFRMWRKSYSISPMKFFHLWNGSDLSLILASNKKVLENQFHTKIME